MSEISDPDARTIVAQVGLVQAAHRRGEAEMASALLGELVERYGIAGIAEVMAARDDRVLLGGEVELLRLVGPALYGRATDSGGSPERQ